MTEFLLEFTTSLDLYTLGSSSTPIGLHIHDEAKMVLLNNNIPLPGFHVRCLHFACKGSNIFTKYVYKIPSILTIHVSIYVSIRFFVHCYVS